MAAVCARHPAAALRPLGCMECVAETSSVSCGLRVFVDDPADQIAEPGPEPVEVNGGTG